MGDSFRLESYLKKRYGLVKLTPGIVKRLNEAYNGELHVDPERLLGCWQQMEQSLNNARMDNVARGNNMSGSALLGYDLSIVLNNYDNYMRYITAAEKSNKESKNTIKQFRTNQATMKNKKKPEKELKDVSDLVDELYDMLGN